jgi:cytochrome c
MQSSPAYPRILIAVLVLALAQLGCSFSAQIGSPSPQPTPASIVQPTQAPTSAAQPTQPPAQPTQAPTSEVQPTPPPAATLSARGTPDEAKAMLQKAVEHYKAVGRQQALADFTGRVAPFFDRDLYVACIDSTLTQSANGGFPNLVGSKVEPVSRAGWNAASANKISSIDYQWLNPATKKAEPKTFYYEKVGSDVCGVGAYHP